MNVNGVNLHPTAQELYGLIAASMMGVRLSEAMAEMRISHCAFACASTRLKRAGLIVNTHDTQNMHARWVLPELRDDVAAVLEFERVQRNEVGAQKRREKRAALSAAKEAEAEAVDSREAQFKHICVSAEGTTPPIPSARRWVFDAKPVRLSNGR